MLLDNSMLLTSSMLLDKCLGKQFSLLRQQRLQPLKKLTYSDVALRVTDPRLGIQVFPPAEQ